MDLTGKLIPGQTPISQEEAVGLLLDIDTLEELDLAEQRNIRSAQIHYFQTGQRPTEIIDEPFLRAVHRRMFDRVWAWAGEFRRSDKNMGVPWPQIALRYRQLRDDPRYWIEQSTYLADELALRYKHRLVSIHPFPNGNGRLRA